MPISGCRKRRRVLHTESTKWFPDILVLSVSKFRLNSRFRVKTRNDAFGFLGWLEMINFLPFKFSNVPEAILQVILKRPRFASVKGGQCLKRKPLSTSVCKERVTFG